MSPAGRRASGPAVGSSSSRQGGVIVLTLLSVLMCGFWAGRMSTMPTQLLQAPFGMATLTGISRPRWQKPAHYAVGGAKDFCAYVMAFEGEARTRAFMASAENASLNVKHVPACNGAEEVSHGRIPTCMPVGGHAGGHAGELGLWCSMERTFATAISTCANEWMVMFESDAIVPVGLETKLQWVLEKKPSAQVLWLDGRHDSRDGPSGCCTVATAYRYDVWPTLQREFDLTNTQAFWSTYSQRERQIVNHTDCPADFYLANVVQHHKFDSFTHPVVPHPRQKTSEIAAMDARYKSEHRTKDWATRLFG
jgi:hypothetical protein